MRMDAVVAMGMVWVPYGIGWGCAGINPFGVLIAQNIAGVPLTSGRFVKLVMMFVFLASRFTTCTAMRARCRRTRRTSLVAHVDYSTGSRRRTTSADASRIAVLVAFFGGLVPVSSTAQRTTTGTYPS